MLIFFSLSFLCFSCAHSVFSSLSFFSFSCRVFARGQTCGAWVFALDVKDTSGQTNCYLLTGATGVAPSPNRASGVKGTWPPKPATPAPTPSGGGGDDLVQYYYGSADMVVAPVLSPIDYSKSSMADKLVWLPPTQSAADALRGNQTRTPAPVGWVERGTQRVHYLTGTQVTEGAMLQKRYPLDAVPVFIKSGAVIPTIPLVAGDLVGTAQKQYTSLVFSVFPGESSGSGVVYEDDGATIGYLVDQHAWTTCAYTHDFATGLITVRISTNGTFAALPATRAVTIQLLNVLPAASVSVATSMGAAATVAHRGDAALSSADAASPTWHFDGEGAMLVVNLVAVSTAAGSATTLTVQLPSWPATDRALMNGLRGAIRMAKLAKLNMDEVRQNPGGQCCVDNVTAPLSEAATAGTALSDLAARSDLTAFQTKLRGFWGMYAGAQVELAKLPNKTATAEVSVLLCTVTFHANHAHNLTRSTFHANHAHNLTRSP